jgi:xanthine/uracil/vitamin C permease (AzgA family)
MEEINQWYVVFTVMYVFGIFFAILDCLCNPELYTFLGVVVATMLILVGVLRINKKEDINLGMLLILFLVVFVGIISFLTISVEFDFMVSSMIYAIVMLGSFILNQSG